MGHVTEQLLLGLFFCGFIKEFNTCPAKLPLKFNGSSAKLKLTSLANRHLIPCL